MKKLLALLLAVVMVVALAACQGNDGTKEPDTQAPTEAPTTAEPETETDAPETTDAKGEGVMTYAEYAAAELDTEVTVETYVQDRQSWWDNKATFYTADQDGAYFLYEMACTEEEYALLVPGTKIRVKGFKSAWAGEVEITDATFEILEGEYIAEPEEIESITNLDQLEEKMNRRVEFKNMVVGAYDADGNAIAYKNAEEKTDDIYFKATLDGKTIDFCVEFYLTGKDTAVYQAVEKLEVGQIIDVECFLYWYNGPNPHVIGLGVAVPEDKEEEGVMTYAEYAEAELDTEVTIETYVQGKQSWWDNKATFYTADQEGAYFIYEMACTEDEYMELVPGTKIRVKGFKSAWAGEVEITDATFEIIDDLLDDDEGYIAKPIDVTALAGAEGLEKFMNRRVIFKGLTVEAQEDGAAFNYKNAEEKTDDLYFKASVNDQSVSFCVEFYLTGKDTDVYQAVEGLQVGDKIDVECFLYWYNGPNPHVTYVTVLPAAE